MAAQAQRHDRIRRLVQTNSVRNQSQLRLLLQQAGFSVTQATLSRDLARIGMIKSAVGYQLPGQSIAAGDDEEVFHRTLRQELIRAVAGGATVVLSTRPGHANALAVELDRRDDEDLLGTIAGDDTIFVATPSTAAARSMASRFRQLADID